jgi:hypothetical protein
VEGRFGDQVRALLEAALQGRWSSSAEGAPADLVLLVGVSGRVAAQHRLREAKAYAAERGVSVEWWCCAGGGRGAWPPAGAD